MYTKFHDPWANTYPASAKAMNWIETQYSELKTTIDAHSHNTEFYPKATADVTFFSLSFMGSGSGFDACLLDGQRVSNLIASVLPVGSIIWWKGTDATLPSGWKICNGQTGTSDYRDRFVIGAGGSYAVGWTGGPATYNGTFTPTGSVTVGAHQLTINEIPSHGHSYTESYSPVSRSYTGGGGGYYHTVDSTSRTAQNQTTGDGAHGHPGSTAAFTAIDPRPLYYALYLIKKVS